MIQASDLRSGSSKSRAGRPLSAKRELHGYNGPLQYLANKGNPDEQMTTVQVGSSRSSKMRRVNLGISTVAGKTSEKLTYPGLLDGNQKLFFYLFSHH